MPQADSPQYLSNNQKTHHPAQQESNSNSTQILQYNPQKAYPMQLAQTMNPMSQQTVSSFVVKYRINEGVIYMKDLQSLIEYIYDRKE